MDERKKKRGWRGTAFSEELKRRRITQQALAAKLTELGEPVSSQSVNAWAQARSRGPKTVLLGELVLRLMAGWPDGRDPRGLNKLRARVVPGHADPRSLRGLLED